MKKGLLVILSGPSGVGKGTIRKAIVERHKIDFVFSISMTTRKPRTGEVDGVDYFFVSKEKFDAAIENNELLEHATFADNCYGTPRKYVEDMINSGRNVLLEIETNGAMQVMQNCKDLKHVSIFIVCSSIEELEKRIRHRNTECEEQVQKRIEKAKTEFELKKYYQYVVENNDVTEAAIKVENIIEEEISRI